MIIKSDIKKLGTLARIDLSEKEEEALAEDLRSILGYFEKLKEAKIGDKEVLDESDYSGPYLRDDIVPSEPYADNLDLVARAPASDEGYIKVKAVFDRA